MVTLNQYGDTVNRNTCDIYCESTDIKPIDNINGITIENGSLLTEIDTGKFYRFNLAEKKWYPIGENEQSIEALNKLIAAAETARFTAVESAKSAQESAATAEKSATEATTNAENIADSVQSITDSAEKIKSLGSSFNSFTNYASNKLNIIEGKPGVAKIYDIGIVDVSSYVNASGYPHRVVENGVYCVYDIPLVTQAKLGNLQLAGNGRPLMVLTSLDFDAIHGGNIPTNGCNPAEFNISITTYTKRQPGGQAEGVYAELTRQGSDFPLASYRISYILMSV